MNRKGRLIAGLLLAMTMLLGSTAMASASGSNFTTIPRQNYANEDATGHKEVTASDSVSFTLFTKRETDNFEIYNLTEINLAASTQSGMIKWNDDFMNWINATYKTTDPTAYAVYQSPTTLGWSRDGETDVTKEAQTVQLLRDFRTAMESDATLKTAMAAYKVAYYKGDDNKTDNVTKQVAVGSNVQHVGEKEITWAGAYTINNIDFGLYYVDAKSVADISKTYQPILVDLVPAQTGPTGHWYVDNTIEATMKYEDLTIDKLINGKKQDIVRAGEIVSFTVDVQLPHYDNTTSDFVAAFDDMQQGFTLIATSATLKYVDAAGKVYHPQTSGLTTDAYGNVKVSDTLNTYTASLCETAVPFYLEGNEHEIVLYATPSGGNVYQFWGVINGSLLEVGQGRLDNQDELRQALEAVNNQRDVVHLEAYPTNKTITRASFTKSLISITFDYEKLMKEATYVESAANAQNYPADGEKDTDKDTLTGFFIPEKMIVSYEAVVNQNSYVGDLNQYDVNTNEVKLYYVDDPTGHIGEAKSIVRAWTYATQIVKVDGEKYETFDKTAEISDANPNPYLDGAVFNIYRLDTIYCGSNNTGSPLWSGAIANGTVLNTVPAEADYAKYFFLMDAYGEDNYANAKTEWIGTLGNCLKYEYTLHQHIFDAATVKTNIAGILGFDSERGVVDYHNIKDYYTAATFKDKYGSAPGAKDTDSVDILRNWIIPDASDTGIEYYIIPEQVDSCRQCTEQHYHLNAYMIFMDGIESTDTAAGVTKVGFDDNSYLLVEKIAPTAEGVTYNVMTDALKYEFVKKARTSDNSYAGFEDDEQNYCDDGVYNLTVRNYAGLTLPSTGGMGTLLFTIIGIAIMFSVMAVILLKKKNKLKQAMSLVAVIAILAASLSAFTIDAHAVTSVSLGDNSTPTITGDGTITFKVNLKDTNDRIEVYKLAESKWKSDTNTYAGPNWLGYITGRFDTIATAIGTTTDKIASPNVLGQQDTDIQDAFLAWLYDNKSSNAMDTATARVDSSKISYEGTVATVKNVSYGIYLIKGTNANGRSYGIITANAIPTRSGPGEEWHIDSNLTVSLKFSDIDVNKKINGKTSDTVTEGDVVDFNIASDVPEYPAVDKDGNVLTDPEEIANYDYSKYVFNMVDEMSEAFSMNEGTLAIKGKTSDENAVFTALSNTEEKTYYTVLFRSKATAATHSSGIMFYSDGVGDDTKCLCADVLYNETNSSYTVDWYAYNKKIGALKKIGTTNAAPPAKMEDENLAGLSATYKEVTGREATTFSRTLESAWQDVRVVTFDYATLKAEAITNVEISYEATVTDKIKVGSQENTNKATFYYQGDLAGNVVPKESTSYAYTYAIQIMKVDGETNEPLSGAKFILFQDKYTFVPETTDLDPENSEAYSRFIFGQNANGSDKIVTDETELTENEAAPIVNFGTVESPNNVTLATFKDLDDNNKSGNRYYYRYIDFKAFECTYARCNSGSAAHQHIEVYEAMPLGDGADDPEDIYQFGSVADASGLILKGLSARNYALIETKAPSGYNILTEAVLFKIKEFTPEQATALMGEDYNLAGFLSDVEIREEDLPHAADFVDIDVTVIDENGQEETVTKHYQAYTNGSYPLTIKNYAGIKLPNTGGVGTKLFTIIGIALMMSVLVVLGMKNRKREYRHN